MTHVRIAASVCLVLVGVSAASVAFGVVRYLHTLDRVTAQIPAVAQSEIAATRDALRSEVAATRSETLTAVARLQRTADRRLASIQSDAVRAVETTSARVDKRLGEVTSNVAGIRSDIHPVLTETAATVKDARDTMDALYPDALALMETTDVTARSVSETMSAVEKAAPRIAEGTARNAENIAGITSDIHTVTERLTRPKTFWGRVWEGLKLATAAVRVL